MIISIPFPAILRHGTIFRPSDLSVHFCLSHARSLDDMHTHPPHSLLARSCCENVGTAQPRQRQKGVKTENGYNAGKSHMTLTCVLSFHFPGFWIIS